MENAPYFADDHNRMGRKRWALRHEKLFVAELYILPNLTRAARIIGFSASCVAKKRKANPDFDEACREALREGWRRYEAALLSHALSAAERSPDDALALGPVAFPDAIKLLARHAPSQRDEATGAIDIAASAEDAGASILKKIGAIKSSRGDTGGGGA